MQRSRREFGFVQGARLEIRHSETFVSFVGFVVKMKLRRTSMIHPPAILFCRYLANFVRRVRPGRQTHRGGEKGKRQDHRLRLDGIQHRRTDHRSVHEKNRPAGRVLARFGDQSDGPGAHRSARRQASLRCHDQQQRRHHGDAQGRYLRQIQLAGRRRPSPKMSSMPISVSPTATRPSVFFTTKA